MVAQGRSASKKYLFGYMDETGVLHTPKTDRIFALGLLKLHHPGLLHRQIVNFKNKKNFYNEFHFTNVTDKNWRLYSEFVQLFLSTPGCVFSALVFDKKQLDLDKFFKGDCYSAYNSYTAKLISENLKKGEYLVVLTDDISTPKSDNFEKQVKKRVKSKSGRNALFGIARVESHAVSEIQMVDVLLGIVGYSFKLKYNLIKRLHKRKNKIKMRLVKFLQNQLRVDSLSRDFEKRIKGGGSFKVKEFNPTKKTVL